MIEPNPGAEQEVYPVPLVYLKVVYNPLDLQVASACIFYVLNNIEANFVQKRGQNHPP